MILPCDLRLITCRMKFLATAVSEIFGVKKKRNASFADSLVSVQPDYTYALRTVVGGAGQSWRWLLSTMMRSRTSVVSC
jgi:hypothetical protein